MEFIIAVLFIAISTILIWKSGQGFENASDYLGRKLSNGVKGATINAIGSSLPELLTTIFFLFVLRNSEGFASGLGTTAGSAIFNAIVIPLIVGLTVLKRIGKEDLRYSKGVIVRDGIALLIVDVLLLVLIKSGGDQARGLGYLEGVYLMVVYFIYLFYLFYTMDKSLMEKPDAEQVKQKITKKTSKSDFFKSIVKLDLTALVIGKKIVNSKLAWILLIISMSLMSGACYVLVESSIHLSYSIGIPLYIVSVLIAAAATSVPDTFLSYKDAKKGNIDDSISNALGSNVFDIGFAIGFPIFVYGLIYGDVELAVDTERNISELLVVLLFLTIVVFVLLGFSSKLSKIKVWILGVLYVGFSLFIVLKVINIEELDFLFNSLYKISELFSFY
jgi:cation:H+ antiporter